MEQTPVYVLTKRPYKGELETQITHRQEDVAYLVSRGWAVVAVGSRPTRSVLDDLVIPQCPR